METSESGFALPSILMLVTILTLVAFSVLALLYFERENAVADIARVKVEYAAESGVLLMAAEIARSGLSDSTRHFQFSDGSHSEAEAILWGALYLVESRGYFGKSHTTRVASLGQTPSEGFSNALCIANTSHQLILTGTSRIEGDVAVGSSGVTTGQLHDYSTPITVPIQGRITHVTPLTFPRTENKRLDEISGHYRNLIASGAGGNTVTKSDYSSTLASVISDSITSVMMPSGVRMNDSLSRGEHRLYLCASGKVVVGSGSKLSGLITIASRDSVVIENGATAEGVVFVSLRGIRVEAASLRSVQLIAPKVTLGRGAYASYPSIVLSLPLEPSLPAAQELTLRSGSTAEGFVGMISPKGDDVALFETGSTISGAAYSNVRMTLDGDVRGSALTYDLFFYSAPTMYLGWKRSGTIKRAEIPDNLLIPPLFAGKRTFSVMEWL